MPATSASGTRVLIALGATLWAVAHLAYEHFTGGVQSHHLLNRSDLPLLSNWLGLVTLPLLGVLVAARVPSGAAARSLWLALAGAIVYGAVLAVSFELRASSVTWALFFGLFAVAALLPVYRAEYVLGFVVGMTFTFGAVLPVMVSSVFIVLSYASRLAWRGASRAARSLARAPG